MTQQVSPEKIAELKNNLKWRNDYSKSATDGKLILVAITGDNGTKYTIYDEIDNVIDSWTE